MARPQKEGLDYFPHDVDMDQDDKVIMVLAKYGMEGYGILNKLMQQLYKDHGYYMTWTERDRLVFNNRVNVDINTLDGVIDECLKWGFFHDDMFQKYEILTSKGFQRRYIEATTRRKEIVLINEYIIGDISEMKEKGKDNIKMINVNNNSLNVYINQVIDDSMCEESTQSKVKEINKKHIGDSDECTNAFDQFWKAYPKKQGKAPALTKWKSYWKKEEIVLTEVLEGLERYLAYVEHERKVRRFDRQYMDGRTWIHQKQWESEWKIEIAQVKSSGRTPPQLPKVTVTEEDLNEHDKLMERIRERTQQQGRVVREYPNVSPNV